MTLTEKAKAIMERGYNAFRNTRVRPDSGHTAIQGGSNEGRILHFGCVVGAIAYEASMLQGMSRDDAQSETVDDDNAKSWVARMFGVSITEVVEIEKGFDAFFDLRASTSEEGCDCPSCRDRRAGGPNVLERAEAAMERERPEMFQVGWHVAKRAVKHYMDLDEAETEAWQVYAEKGLATYVPRKPIALWNLPPRDSKGRFMSEAEIDAAIANVEARIQEECEGEDCPEEVEYLVR